MHPTIFQLNAFGQLRLPEAQAQSVLGHLRGGCARCLGALAHHLAVWMDDESAAEVRERTAPPWRAGLRAAVLQAVERLGRAAARRRTRPEADARVRKVRTMLEAEGLSALGRLPRHLLGRPAIEALLELARGPGLEDPRLRLCTLEIAVDLLAGSAGEGDEAERRRALRRRAVLDLAHIHRMLGNLRTAQELIDQAREELTPDDPLAAAAVLTSQATLLGDQGSHAAALAGLAAVVAIHRRQVKPRQLARTLVSYGLYAGFAGRFDSALARHRDALALLDPESDPLLACAAIGNSCDSLLMSGRWHQGLALMRRHGALLERNPSVLNRARFNRLEGRLLKHTGDPAGAERAFAASRRAFAAFGKRYVAGAVALDQASAREARNDWSGAQELIAEGTDLLLRTEPQREVYLAVMLLRTTARFSATRATLPLEQVIDFLDAAEFNPSKRFHSSLAAGS